mmetsp:Transcript_13747/g.51412  ORF Transcript_13747/g.51412 Transcript_13747/m.51412 type:complete len:209 (-) Transcript_13747:49-675(-)
MLYDSNKNVPNTIPDEITAQYPSESIRFSAYRIRCRAVGAFVPSSATVRSVGSSGSGFSLSLLLFLSSSPPNTPPTSRRTSRARVLEAGPKRRQAPRKTRASPILSCDARRTLRTRRVSFSDVPRVAVGAGGTRRRALPVYGDARHVPAVAGVIATSATIGADCQASNADRDRGWKIGTENRCARNTDRRQDGAPATGGTLGLTLTRR